MNRLQVYSATANAVYALHWPLVQPYLIGGVGYYHMLSRYTVTPAASSGFAPYEVEPTTNGIGINAGFGLKAGLGRVGVFGEWRFHDVFAAAGNSSYGYTTYAPFTIGVTF